MYTTNFNINFIGKRKSALIFSALLILLTCTSLILRGGPNFGIDFTGGVSLTIPFDTDDIAEHRERVEERIATMQFADYELKTLSDADAAYLQIIVSQGEHDAAEVRESILSELQDIYPNLLHNREISAEVVGPRVGRELTANAFKAIAFSLLVIILYVAFRFKLAYGIGAIAALVHDIIITIGIFSIFNWEISLPVIAAILTIVGYSLNDTIVLFDRIRENLNEHKDKSLSLSDTLNISVNQTLSRTVITSITTLFVVTSIFVTFLPTENVLKYFSAALLVGVIAGTYSSIFIATPVLIQLNKKWPIDK
ncbi:protein translocase subunit SecF [Chitinivibrio alkaliphilus]|uniref:Protein-export membrane protein SecF n=1 Tax=Chitinivibrio alkaliphilus ACht1 TaxID=1313304 RepID=U7DCG0_9BACT|nr:protein translocase subunit SecF [Chitinivibrio alkaliphilus]ERP32115.1 protein-export membrane protein SecF [Chitinivibrio alkaliphilus ACht1]